MPNAFTLAELRAATDERLIELHDGAATSTTVGTDYFLDEIHRREQDRALRTSVRLSITNTILALAAVVVAVIALIR